MRDWRRINLANLSNNSWGQDCRLNQGWLAKLALVSPSLKRTGPKMYESINVPPRLFLYHPSCADGGLCYSMPTQLRMERTICQQKNLFKTSSECFLMVGTSRVFSYWQELLIPAKTGEWSLVTPMTNL